MSADELFKSARDAAFEKKNYNSAIMYAKQALSINTEYTDVVIFLGRIYAWKKMPDSSRYFFNEAVKQQPKYIDAYVGYIDLEIWNDNLEEALVLVEKGLSYDGANVQLLIRKANILNRQRDFTPAIKILDTILSIDKKNTAARALASQIRDNVSKNRIGLKYDYVYFDKQFPNPWQFVSLDYTRQTKTGAYTARLNYANRFQTDGLQYELEAYPRFSKTFYAYANIAYSADVGVFPRWRAGASLYINLPKAFETEVGIRYLYFNNDAFIYTVYLGKYYSNFLFGARTYLAPVSQNIAQSYSLLARYYFKGIDDYIGISFGAGLSPDDRRVNIQLDNVYKLRTYSGEFVVRHSIKRLNIITFNVSLLNQEYRPSTVGNQLQVGIGYIRRF